MTPLRTAAFVLVGAALQAAPTMLRVGLPSYPAHLHWMVSPQPQTQAINMLVVEALVSKSLWTDEIEPRLAKKFSTLEKGKRWAFELDPEARFQNGERVSAEDVIFSWDLIFSKQSKATTYQNYFKDWKRPVVRKDGAIEFESPYPSYRNLSLLTEFLILPRKVHASEGYTQQKLVGSGPYQIESISEGRSITLVRSPHYWGETKPWGRMFPQTPRIEFLVTSDPNQAWKKVQQKQLDYLYVLSSAAWVKQVVPAFSESKEARAVAFQSKLPGGVAVFLWNHHNPLFKAPAERCALQQLMDRSYWTKQIFSGAYEAASGLFPSNSQAHDPNLKVAPFSTESAQALLAGQGWRKNAEGILEKKNRPFAFELLLDNPSQETIATVFQEDLKKAGIEMRIKTVDWASAKNRLQNRQFDSALVYWQDPRLDTLDEEWGSRFATAIPATNRTGFADAQIDKWLASLQATLDADRRIGFYRRIERALVEQCVVGLGWENTQTRLAVSRAHLDPFRPLPPYSDWTNAFWAMAAHVSEKQP